MFDANGAARALPVGLRQIPAAADSGDRATSGGSSVALDIRTHHRGQLREPHDPLWMALTVECEQRVRSVLPP